MAIDAPTLLAACETVYDSPQIVAGPNGRDAASFDPTSLTLVFRGTLTEGLAAESDWINDFHADLVASPLFPGKVHEGFLASFLSLLPDIRDFDPVHIAGHSKGGALALLAGWYFRELEPIVVTFAAPRVSDCAFARNYVATAYRFENPSDIVPRIPFFHDSPGFRVIAPASFVAPRGVRLNHSIDTGYKPWVK